MRVYKVVSDSHSCITRGDLCLNYQINLITYPEVKNSPLFAFNNLAEALKFKACTIGLYGKREILLCEAEAWEGNLSFIPNAIWVSVKDLIQWWNDMTIGHYNWSLLKGTVLCKWVKPIEIVG